MDGSSSWAGCDPDEPDCYAEEYIVSYEWDLDRNTDSDGDGVENNDVDATGERQYSGKRGLQEHGTSGSPSPITTD